MVCASPSVYCENGTEWTYTCTEPDGHDLGQHIYALDPGTQTPPADGSS